MTRDRQRKSAREQLADLVGPLRAERMHEAFAAGVLATIKEQAAPESAPVSDPPAVAALRAELATYGVVITHVTEGHPAMVVIEATDSYVTIGELHDGWYEQLGPGGPGVTATVLYVTRRNRGHAGFSVSGFLDEGDSEPVDSVRSSLYFFVLLEEQRVWVLARGALRDFYEKIDRGERVTRFAKAKTGALRLLLPKKSLGFSLEQAVALDDGPHEALLSAETIALERRVMYGLMLLAGLRGSEATGRRWRDYDPEAQPLGRLTVASQADGNKGERATKTGAVREVPVVPSLASLLAEWKLHGFAMRFGRCPRPEDPIVPGPRCKPERLTFRGGTTVYVGLGRDLDKLGLRRVPALRHSMRATFLTQLEASGANMAIARRCTHSAPSDVVSGYVRTGWGDVCREVAKLGIELRKGAEVIPIRRAVGATSGAIGEGGGEKSRENRERG